MGRAFTAGDLQYGNDMFAGSGGVSSGNRHIGFMPAFFDIETGRMELSCFADGKPAPMHLLDGLPEAWIVERDAFGRVVAVKHTVVAGFARDGVFYTRAQAAADVRWRQTAKTR